MARPNTSVARERPPASAAATSAQSGTTTKSPRKRKKYQFTYFHYDPPPYWYVWPEIPKCTKPMPHSRQVTPELLKEPMGQTSENAEKTAATTTRQEATAKTMPTVQPLTTAATADVNVPSSAQTRQSQVHQPEQRPAKKLSRFTVTPVRTPLPPAMTTVQTAATPQNVGLAKAGAALTAGQCPASMVTPARIQQAPLSIPFPTSKLVSVDPATKQDPSQQEETIKFVVTPVTGQGQKFRVTPMPERKRSTQHAATPSSYIVTTDLVQPLSPVQATPPTQAALQRPSQPLPQTQQHAQSFAQQAVDVAEVAHRPAPTTVAAQSNVVRSTRVTRVAASRQPLPVLVEEPELEELEDVTQAEATSTSTSQISTISSASSDVSTAGSMSTWKTVIRRPQEPTLYFVVEPCGRSHQTASIDKESSTAETREQRIHSSTEAVRCGVSSGHKVIAFAELYMRVISECNQTEAIFERLNVRLCDLERAHEELRARTANRPVQYNQSQ